jgi:hypothetical protein
MAVMTGQHRHINKMDYWIVGIILIYHHGVRYLKYTYNKYMTLQYWELVFVHGNRQWRCTRLTFPLSTAATYMTSHHLPAIASPSGYTSLAGSHADCPEPFYLRVSSTWGTSKWF